MNENGNKNALCCFYLLVLVFGAWFHLLFVAFCCSSLLVLVFETESVLLFWFFVDVSVSKLLVLFFCWYGKPKRATKGKKVQIETRL